MENLTIVAFLVGFFVTWITIHKRVIKEKKPPYGMGDHSLIKNYQYKPTYHKRLVLIIESFSNIEDLLTLIRNILKQEIKVDSIILISKNETLNKVQLIQNTCILNKVGGLSFLLKESSNNTILLFIRSGGFDAFSEPQFLPRFLNSNFSTTNLVKIDTDSINVDIDRVYTQY
jgi:hypothetical protein